MPALMTLLAEEHATLIMPTWAFPLTAALGFLLAALITAGFRNVAHRHHVKTDAQALDEHATDHGGHH